ncbi:MAG TPA: phosphatidate cytidylyltransferase, partial [Gammaproteobacteria bacterium]|nr:phosphatidate cytidylyltransferase [Gammaproteobacteria bacterium]
MLKARLISAAIMVPLVIYGVLALPAAPFALLLGLVLVLGAWEWGQLVPLAGAAARLLYCAAVAGLMWLLWRVGLHDAIGAVLALAVAWWLFALYWLTHTQLCAQPSPACTGFKLLAGILAMVPAWAALVTLQGSGPDGPALTLGLMVMVWLADSGAYFAGRHWGRNKLAPHISPGKTREGAYGGLLASLLFVAVAGGVYSHSLR